MIESLDYIFSLSSLIILAVNILILIKSRKKQSDLKWLCIFLIWAFLIQIIAPDYGKIFGNNLPLLHLYTAFEFVFLSLFYKAILIDKLKIARYFPFFFTFTILILIANSIFLEPLTEFNSNAKAFVQVIIMAYTVIYFFNRISTEVSKDNLLFNRINAAILLYYAGSLLYFVFAQFLLEISSVMFRVFVLCNSLLYMIFQVLILISIWRLVFPKTEKEHTNSGLI